MVLLLFFLLFLFLAPDRQMPLAILTRRLIQLSAGSSPKMMLAGGVIDLVAEERFMPDAQKSSMTSNACEIRSSCTFTLGRWTLKQNEKRWHTFSRKAELHKTGEELSGTAKKLGSELKDAYVRLRKAL